MREEFPFNPSHKPIEFKPTLAYRLSIFRKNEEIVNETFLVIDQQNISQK
jgi:hypothetical protein